MRKGTYHTKETKKKISENTRRGMNNETVKECLKKFRKINQEKYPNYGKKGFKESQEVIEKKRRLMKIVMNKPEVKMKVKEALKIVQSNPVFREKIRNSVIKAYLRGCYSKCPNNPEKILNEILLQTFPHQFIFSGDGKISIGGFIPDFINLKNKLVIEVFGTYWHNLPNYIERDKKRLESYEKEGFKTLIVWDNELEDLDSLLVKLKNFIDLEVQIGTVL